MATTKTKVELFPDEQFIQDAIKDGRCTKQELGMKALGRPDTAYQSRELHLDMNHVRLLEGIQRDHGKLGPVVVFMADIPKKPRYILADGFHRHAALSNMRAKSIWAYVIESTPSMVEHEARLFSAMCNRRLCLPRKREDINKAIEILVGDPECRLWTDSRIAAHCGASINAVIKIRNDWTMRNGLDFPERVIDQRGRSFPYRRTPGEYVGTKIGRDGKALYRSSLGGKTINLGYDKSEAQKKVKEMAQEKNATYEMIGQSSRLMGFFGARGLVFQSCFGRGNESVRFPGHFGHGVIWTSYIFNGTVDFVSAIGRLCVLNAHSSLIGQRLVILCAPNSVPNEVASLSQKLGIEFLTHEELVSSLKGEQGEAANGTAEPE